MNADYTYYSIPENVRAYDRCWFFSDEFGRRSYEQYFQQHKCTDYNGYVKSHFDTTGYFNSFLSDNLNILARMVNLMQSALQQTVGKKLLPFPKLIIVVLDDDIIKVIGEDSQNALSASYSRVLNYIMNEYARCISTYKEFLPVKCLKTRYPHIIWIQCPEHENFSNNSQRFEFNHCLQEIIHFHPNVSTLELKKVWNTKNGNLYIKECQRYTAEGYRDYWEAVDRTVRYCDSIVLKKLDNGMRKSLKLSGDTKFGQKDQRYGQKDQKDRFHWKNMKFNVNYDDGDKKFRKLSLLPP